MKTSNGKQFLRNTSGLSLSWSMPLAIEVAMLLGIGVMVSILHAKFRLPMNIPGRHGLDFMLLIMSARLMSRFRFAATTATISAALFTLVPFLGFTDVFLPVYYIAIGLSIDLLFFGMKKWGTSMILIALVGGLSYTMIPLSRFVLFAAGYPIGSFLKHGVAMPFLTHFLFGAIGSVASALIITAINRTKVRREN